MKKSVLIIVVMMLSVYGNFLYAQNEMMDQQLRTAIDQLDRARSTENLQNARSLFERIGSIAPEQWLPVYYQAYTNITLSFRKWGTPEQEKYLQEAGECIDKLKKMKGLSKEVLSEIKTITGYWHYAQISVNPQVNGPRDSGLVISLLAEAIKLNPSNPRPIAINAYFQKRMLKTMGGSYSAYEKDLEKAEQLHQAEDKSTVSPHWSYREGVH